MRFAHAALIGAWLLMQPPVDCAQYVAQKPIAPPDASWSVVETFKDHLSCYAKQFEERSGCRGCAMFANYPIINSEHCDVCVAADDPRLKK